MDPGAQNCLQKIPVYSAWTDLQPDVAMARAMLSLRWGRGAAPSPGSRWRVCRRAGGLSGSLKEEATRPAGLNQATP